MNFVLSLVLLVSVVFSTEHQHQHLQKRATNRRPAFFGNSELSRTPKCHMTAAYPPSDDRLLKEFVINLDDPPSTRWSVPITTYATPIKSLLQLLFSSAPMKLLLKMIGDESTDILDRMPNDYGLEISGIADILNVTIGELIVFNIAYELFGVCTSIVAQDANGHVYHARNLDFGLWPNFNFSDFQWGLTSHLRDCLFMANFTKNGSVIYRSVVFGGYVGLLTGVKKNSMSISVNTRFDKNFDKYLLKWLLDATDTSQFLAFMTRIAIETYDTYDEAVDYMLNTSLVGPSYIIIGGVAENEGCVITYGPNKTLVNQWSIPQALPVNNTDQAPFYVLETNYDHWVPPPFFDDRRMPAEKCMDEIGSKGMDWYSLYNVLNAHPNRNRLTTYTALMDTSYGGLVAYKQYCTEINCSPW